MPTVDQLLYEFPCNERFRTYLRLESLFNRYDWLCSQDDKFAHQTAITALFDLLDATARSDLRTDLLQELERQRQRLSTQRDVAHDEEQEPGLWLSEVQACLIQVKATVGRTGQSVRENQWLQLIRTRQTIAGGTCEFDLPQLHHWLHQPPEVRRRELEFYGETLAPIRTAVRLLLKLTRATSVVSRAEAPQGMLQLHSKAGHALVRVWLPLESDIIPEVSANKFMFWIRFSKLDEQHKPHPVRDNITFKLGLCGFN